MRRTGLWWVTVAAVMIVGCSKTDDKQPSIAQPPASNPAAVGTGGAGADVKSDGDFVREVALMTMAEIELSRMAFERATTPAVKAFAQKMIDEDGAAQNALKGVVSGQSIDWPVQLDEKHRKTAGALTKKQGGEFDRDYLEAMIDGHQNLAAILESRLDVQSLAEWKTAAAARTQRNALPDPNVELRDVPIRPNKSASDITTKINQWAAETYPAAQKHLDTARALENAAKKRSTT